MKNTSEKVHFWYSRMHRASNLTKNKLNHLYLARVSIQFSQHLFTAHFLVTTAVNFYCLNDEYLTTLWPKVKKTKLLFSMYERV